MREQLPSLARTDTIQGGVALAAAFIEQHPLLFMEGGSELFAYLSMEECQFCAHEQERAQHAVDERGCTVGGEFVVYKNDAKFRFDLEQLDEPLLIVQFEVYEPPYTFVNAAGEITDQGGDKFRGWPRAPVSRRPVAGSRVRHTDHRAHRLGGCPAGGQGHARTEVTLDKSA